MDIPDMVKKKSHILYRNILDFIGSRKVKTYSHTSKIIRRFNDDDLEKILNLDESCTTINKYKILKYSKLFRNIFYVYEANGSIVAYAGFYIHLKFEDLHCVQKATVFSVCVEKTMRGKGIFTTIYTECFKELKNNNVHSVYACIDVNNTASLSAHQKFGFRVIEKNSKGCGENYHKFESFLNDSTHNSH
jgi:L-amino acid N-acyltransferase YncA